MLVDNFSPHDFNTPVLNRFYHIFKPRFNISEMEHRNHTIDLLRFLASFSVAVFHFNEPITYIDNWYRNFIKMGYLGVPIFFIISGYCIMLTASRSRSALNFLINRLFRIMPAYWLSLLIVLIVIVYQKVTTGYNSVTPLPKDLVSISAVLTLLTDPFSSVPTMNWVYWSLTYELFFYLLIAISLNFAETIRLPFLLFISFLALAIPVPPKALFFLDNWPTFVLGSGIYLIYHEQNQKRKLVAIALMLISVITIAKNMWSTGGEYWAAVIIGAILIPLSHHIKIKKNVFSKLGDYSYAVYLIHVPIGCFLFGTLKTPLFQKDIFLNISFDLVVYAFISWLAFLIFKYIEKPFIQIGRNLSSNKSEIVK